MTDVHTAATADLDPGTLYQLLRLRSDVFIVEQACAYPDLDGRDLEPTTRHLWTADEAGPTAYLRMLQDAAACRIGRVCTRIDARGAGLAAALMTTALSDCAGAPVVLDAQSHLAQWYARFGFEQDGPGFLEDDIAHVPMRRGATPSTAR